MGFRLNKRIRLGKGLRLNLGTKGVSLSMGRPGAWYTVHSSGRTTRTVGIPGTGLSHRTQSRLPGTARRRRKPEPAVLALPRPKLFSPKDEKAFVRGVAHYYRKDFASALAAFEESMAADPRGTHVGEEYFAALSLIGLGRHDDAAVMLETVLASRVPLPDPLMLEYDVQASARVAVTPHVVAELPAGHLAAALMLAEIQQHLGRTDAAAALLESLGAVSRDALFALSLADLYADLGRWDEVLRVSDDFTTNADDVTAQLLVLRGRALRAKGLHSAALEVLKEAAKSKRRTADIVLAARYERALTFDAAGKRTQARRELEKVYAERPDFEDVASRLGV